MMAIRLNDPVRYLGSGIHAMRIGRISGIEHKLKHELFTQYTIRFHDGAIIRASECEVILSVPYQFKFSERCLV